MDPTTLESALLRADVKELIAVVRQLVATTPQRSKTWLTPSEFAKIAGIHVRTVKNWRDTGKLRPESFRKNGSSYQFHAEFALRDAQALRPDLREVA